jgi:hypothetical protein
LLFTFIRTVSRHVKAHTSTRTRTNPEFAEEITFFELFPSLARRMRLHLRDASGIVLATAFIDMSQISDNANDGFMPTFGPAYINLYGSLQPPTEQVHF